MVRKFFEDDSGDIDLIERNDADTGEVVYKMADNGTPELIITVGHRPFAGSKGHVSGQLLL